MPRLRKAIFNNKVYFLTLSVQEGIMLPANDLVKFVIKSALLRALKHHPITISHFIVNGTHIHIVLRVYNPQDIPGFMERFKTESAHYLNNLIGRNQRTLWCKSYDSPQLLQAPDVIEKIAYLYTNPVKDGLIDSIEHYPGLSSWQNYKTKKSYIKAQLLKRDDVFEAAQDQGDTYFRRKKELLSKSAGKERVIKIDTDDWMKAFPNLDKNETNQQIQDLIKQKEEEIRNNFRKEKRTFMGLAKLINQGINLLYTSKRSGKKMWCISFNKDLRKSYIRKLKELARRATEVYLSWCQGDTTQRIPEGMFAPRMPVLANYFVG